MNPTFTATVTAGTRRWHSSYLTTIKENTLVAARDWGQFITGSGQIDIQVNLVSSSSYLLSDAHRSLATGSASYTEYTVANFEGRSKFMVHEGPYIEIMTGYDPNGAAPDIIIYIDEDKLYQNYYLTSWFDSNPYDQTHIVPTERYDGLAVLTHEIGHALGFNGYRGMYGLFGDLFGDFFSRFDENVIISGDNAYFVGPTAQSVYGAAVPLTSERLIISERIYHFGNFSNGGAVPPTVATAVEYMYNEGMMTPIFFRGTSSDVSNLDLAILKDIGYNVSFDDNIFRFFNRSTGTHFYTANIDEKNFVKTYLANFNYEGVAFQTEATAQTGHAVYRFYNTNMDSHFYTISDYERDFVRQNLSNYQYEGQVFYAYDNNSSGDHEALYRFFNTATGTHFYTASVVERDSVVANLPSFQYEGIGFYIE